MIDKPLGTDTDGGMLVRWDTSHLLEEGDFATSLPCAGKEDRIWLLALWESEMSPGRNWIGKTFKISDYICGPVLLSNRDTGEETMAIRTVFLGPEQPPISFTAVSALKAIKKISKAVGTLPPWDPPVEVLLTLRSAGGQNQTYVFKPVVAGK